MPLATLTPADKTRLRSQGEEALKVLGAGVIPALLAFMAQSPAAGAMLLALARQVGQVFATSENAQLALRELEATGVLTDLQAAMLRVLVYLHSLEPAQVPLAPPIPLNQQPMEPQP